MATPTILLVNSNEMEREFLEEVVKRFDFSVHAVHCAEDALGRLPEEVYAAIIIEFDLPKMSGLQFAREIRRLEAELEKRTPLIAIFEYADQCDLTELREALIEDFMIRPLDAESLRRILLRHVYCSGRPNLKILTPIPPNTLSP